MSTFIIYFGIGIIFQAIITIKDAVISRLTGEKSVNDVKTSWFILFKLFEILMWPVEITLTIYIIAAMVFKKSPEWVKKSSEGIDIFIENGTKD